MKHNIIKTENYLLVVDKSEIKEGDWLYHSVHGIRLFNEQETKNFDSKTYSDKNWKKIIAHLPLNPPFIYGYTNSPILEGVDLLPPLEDGIIGKPLDNYIRERHNQDECVGFIDGYNKAKEKYKYTEEDMIKAAKYGYEFRDTTSFPEHKFEDSCINNTKQWLQSLQQPKLPVGFEFKIQKNCPFDFTSRCTMDRCNCESKIKTTTNSQGFTQLLGEYQY